MSENSAQILERLSFAAAPAVDPLKAWAGLRGTSGLIWPERLCCGLIDVVDALAGNEIYIDPVLGVVIGEAGRIKSLMVERDDLNLRFGGNPLLGPIISATRKVLTDRAMPCDYISRLGGWPAASGKEERIAVIDSGLTLGHAALSRTGLKTWYGSLVRSSPGMNDLNGHGTNCIGLVAADGSCGERMGVVPQCHLAVGQTDPSMAGGIVASVQFLLLCAWAIHCCGVRVISFSYGVPREEVTKAGYDPDVFAEIARRLRCNNVALIFCAAGNDNRDRVLFPADCKGVIPVSGYELSGEENCAVAPNLYLSGFGCPTSPEDDLLLGPGAPFALVTTGDARYKPCDRVEFGESSAACAFVAGVAVLYLQKYGSQTTLDGIVGLMKKNAEPITTPKRPGCVWRGVKFPK